MYSYSVAYGLVTRKTRNLYDELLESMKDAFKKIVPESRIRIELVFIDYERAMMGPFRKVFKCA